MHLERNNFDIREGARVSNIELRLLQDGVPTTTTHEDEPENQMHLVPAPNVRDDRHNVHEVIGEALVVFARLLQTHD
jgi:hypothetical protein